MKQKLGITTIVFFITLIPAICSAENTKIEAKSDANTKTVTTTEKKKKLNLWVDCGIGAMIFDNTAWAAATSNIIWDLGITATTSNISSQETCNSKKAQMAMYVGATYANLEEETVKGDGEHMHAMLNIMGCDKASHNEIINSVRNDFRKSLQNTEYSNKTKQERAQGYFNLVDQNIDNHYAQFCNVI